MHHLRHHPKAPHQRLQQNDLVSLARGIAIDDETCQDIDSLINNKTKYGFVGKYYLDWAFLLSAVDKIRLFDADVERTPMLSLNRTSL